MMLFSYLYLSIRAVILNFLILSMNFSLLKITHSYLFSGCKYKTLYSLNKKFLRNFLKNVKIILTNCMTVAYVSQKSSKSNQIG